MIRLAQSGDEDSVVDIYNQAIDARFQTAFTVRFTKEQGAAWFAEHLNERFPLFVYVIDNQIIGWFSISPYRKDRGALRYAVEISYFLDSRFQGKGIGGQLLERGIQVCRDLGYKTLLAVILDRNIASIRLVEKFGFEKWAFLPNIADYEGVECSHLFYGLKIG